MAKRLGRAICLDLATQGYTYTVIAPHLHTNGAPSAHVLGCDLSDQSARATLMPRAIALAGRV